MGCDPPGSSVREILRARILEGVATSSSRGSSQPRDRTHAHWQAASLPRAPAEGTDDDLKAAVGWLRTAGWNGPRTDPCHPPAAEDAAAPANALARPGLSALERLSAPRRAPRGRAWTLAAGGKAGEPGRARWDATPGTAGAARRTWTARTVTREIFMHHLHSVISEWSPCKALYFLKSRDHQRNEP